ncbi:MAG: N-acetylmuramoyl-L-alanine amidase [Bacteroidales bacterium]|nr:N-acetylmuramoyl-L-alanine amidase [Bacteroidales bacterium]MCF8406188.1 N-acetylmuramoyl-L-alanine amidase [Bacteroidales bacterium]
MNKIVATLIALLLFSNLFSQDFTGISICINPGHGGNDSDDRYMEETGFYESEGNLTKGLYLRDILESYGATIVMSRVTNFTADDLPLSQISQIANENNVDFFHSIHSNGYNGVSNYPLMLFRGYDNAPIFPAAKEMGHIMWQKLWDNGNGWTHTGERNRGDFDFYPNWSDGLGVLRELTMPGVLSEGSFHDYSPESWRLTNIDYRKHEAWVFARSYVDFFETDSFIIGNVAGIIRDPNSSPDFYSAPNTKDVDAPINNSTVTLNPGNLVYQVDTMNNGYFYFDSIAPGDYVLTFMAENFYTDSANITVVANETSFVNQYLQIDTTIAPQVLRHSPISTVNDSVAPNQEFLVYFDYQMDKTSVENAISISPAVELVFLWDDEAKILSIKPETVYMDGSQHILTISTEAKHIWNVALLDPYVFDFYTKKRTHLVIEDMYPKEGMEEVSTILQFRLYFDAPLDVTTITDNIMLYDADNAIVPVGGEVIFEEAGKGFYFFEAESELDIGSYYKLVILNNLSDKFGISISNNQEINFKTITEPYELGKVFLNFEDVSSWWDPNGSGSTVGTIDVLTTFSTSSNYVINGTYSGKLNYAFENDNGGVVRTHNTATPSVGSDMSSKIGFWVFGDLSYNNLEYWFYPSTGYSPVFVDVIDWAGWELKYIPFSDITSAGSARFTSLVVNQTEGGAKSGTLYFDDGQIQSLTGIPFTTVAESSLKPNYPNPFSSETSFSYSLPVDSKVKLSVYNIMGEQVAVLINENKFGGSHNFVWNATDDKGNRLSQGIYVYKFEAISLNDKSKVLMESGKCILMK